MPKGPSVQLPLQPCPICNSSFSTRLDIIDHLQSAHTSSELHSLELKIALFYDLHLCPLCIQQHQARLCSQRRGLNLHLRNTHHRVQGRDLQPTSSLANYSTNTSCITNVFHLIDADHQWPSTLEWLMHLQPRPPFFRVSLLSKFSTDSFDHTNVSPQHWDDIRWVSDTFCQSRLNQNGLIILGSPIGNTQFVSTTLEAKIQRFKQDIRFLHKRLPHSPLAKFQPFHHSLQHKFAFLQLADTFQPSTIFDGATATSSYIRSLQQLSRQFLTDLLTLPVPLPDDSWLMATLPTRHGGLGFYDPQHASLTAFARPTLRFLHTLQHGFTGKNFFHSPDDSLSQSPHQPKLHSLPEPFDDFFRHSHSVRWYDQLSQLLSLAIPDTPLQSLLHSKKDPTPILCTASHTLALTRFQHALPASSSHIQHNQLSLHAVPLSTALTALPLHVASHRTPNYLFVTALKLKLGLPFLSTPTPCPCGSIMDIYGAHAFSCCSRNKAACHNRVRDAFYVILHHLAPLAGLCVSSSDVLLEPTSLLPSYPTKCPADIAIHIQPQALPSVSHLLIDFTNIPFLPEATQDSSLSSVSVHHQRKENLKFTGKTGENISPGDLPHTILRHHYAFLPATFDPGGTLGPALTGFLWSTSHRPLTAIPPLTTTHRPLHPDACHVRDFCYEHISTFNLFARADIGWQSSHPDQWFTPHYTAQLPSQWAHRLLGQNLLLALSSHLYRSISDVSYSKTTRTLSCAPTLEPIHTQQIHDIIPPHFYTTTNISASPGGSSAPH